MTKVQFSVFPGDIFFKKINICIFLHIIQWEERGESSLKNSETWMTSSQLWTTEWQSIFAICFSLHLIHFISNKYYLLDVCPLLLLNIDIRHVILFWDIATHWHRNDRIVISLKENVYFFSKYIQNALNFIPIYTWIISLEEKKKYYWIMWKLFAFWMKNLKMSTQN